MKGYQTIYITIAIISCVFFVSMKFFFGPYCAARVIAISPQNKEQEQICKVVVLYNLDTALVKISSLERLKIHADTTDFYPRNSKDGVLSIGDTITVSERKTLFLETYYKPELHIKLVGFIGGERVWF